MAFVITGISALLFIVAILGWKLLARRRSTRPTVYDAERVVDFPDALKPLTIYLAGEDGHLWGAALLCPCGCGERIELNLLQQVRPCWTMESHVNGTVTLTPSVWRQKGCRSHFFIRVGRVDWC